MTARVKRAAEVRVASMVDRRRALPRRIPRRLEARARARVSRLAGERGDVARDTDDRETVRPVRLHVDVQHRCHRAASARGAPDRRALRVEHENAPRARPRDRAPARSTPCPVETTPRILAFLSFFFSPERASTEPNAPTARVGDSSVPPATFGAPQTDLEASSTGVTGSRRSRATAGRHRGARSTSTTWADARRRPTRLAVLSIPVTSRPAIVSRWATSFDGEAHRPRSAVSHLIGTRTARTAPGTASRSRRSAGCRPMPVTQESDPLDAQPRREAGVNVRIEAHRSRGSRRAPYRRRVSRSSPRACTCGSRRRRR